MSDKFQHKKSLGQHFLTSDYVPKLMCDAGAVGAGDLIVEIGPGTGVLTKEILARGAKVIAIETDERALSSLEETFANEITNDKLTLIQADARKLDLASLNIEAGKYKVIANIPYYISGLLFRTFLDTDYQPSDLVFLVQKELAERIARDQKNSLLALSINVFGKVKYESTIKRGHFTPAPKVDSAIISITNINNEYFNTFSKELFFSIIKQGFASKRKQLAPNLKADFSPEITKEILSEINLSPTTRAEDLSLTEWHSLITRLIST